jgi:hypothetical protein
VVITVIIKSIDINVNYFKTFTSDAITTIASFTAINSSCNFSSTVAAIRAP